MRLLSTKELSLIWGISVRHIAVLYGEGRIEGAQRVGASWVIPEGTEKNKDARIKSGKYMKNICEVKGNGRTT